MWGEFDGNTLMIVLLLTDSTYPCFIDWQYTSMFHWLTVHIHVSLTDSTYPSFIDWQYISIFHWHSTHPCFIDWQYISIFHWLTVHIHLSLTDNETWICTVNKWMNGCVLTDSTHPFIHLLTVHIHLIYLYLFYLSLILPVHQSLIMSIFNWLTLHIHLSLIDLTGPSFIDWLYMSICQWLWHPCLKAVSRTPYHFSLNDLHVHLFIIMIIRPSFIDWLYHVYTFIFYWLAPLIDMWVLFNCPLNKGILTLLVIKPNM